MTKTNKKKIAETFITSKKLRDFVLQENLSDMDLTMIIIQDPYLYIDKVKSHLDLIRNSGLDFLYDYYQGFLHWYHDFITNDGSAVYIADTGEGSLIADRFYFMDYDDIIKNIDEIYDEDNIFLRVVKKNMKIDRHYEKITFHKPNVIMGHSFHPKNYDDDFYIVNISFLFHTHDIVRNILTGEYAIVTKTPTACPVRISPDMDDLLINTEGIQHEYGTSLWYDHSDPYLYEVVNDDDPDFLSDPSSKLLLEMKHQCGKNVSFYDTLYFFKHHQMRLSGIDG